MADHDIKNAAQQAMKDADVRRDMWFFLLPMDSMQS